MFLAVRSKYFLASMAFLTALWFMLDLFSSKRRYSSSLMRLKDSKNLTFFALGDIGGIGRKPYSTRTQRQVASIMGKQAELRNVSLILCLGDNFYPHGVTTVDDPRFKATFEDVYSSRALVRARWLMVAGNHDYEGNINAQLEYSKKSHRWYFPYLYYTEAYRISEDSNAILQIVVTDTKLICADSSRKTKYKSNSPTRKEHRSWVKETLRDSKAEYLVVAGHNPIFSAGIHGGSSCLLSFLKPLLVKYGVTAYVSGHDHNFQHIKEDDKQVNYFVSGNGNYHDSGNAERIHLYQKDLKVIYGSTGGFTMFVASPSTLTVTHIDKKGRSIYSTQISPRRAS